MRRCVLEVMKMVENGEEEKWKKDEEWMKKNFGWLMDIKLVD